MSWPPPEIEEMYRQQEANEDSQERKGMAWALVIVIAFYAAVGLGIKFLL